LHICYGSSLVYSGFIDSIYITTSRDAFICSLWAFLGLDGWLTCVCFRPWLSASTTSRSTTIITTIITTITPSTLPSLSGLLLQLCIRALLLFLRVIRRHLRGITISETPINQKETVEKMYKHTVNCMYSTNKLLKKIRSLCRLQ